MNPLVRLISNAPNRAVLSNQVGYVCAHQEPEAGVFLRLLRQQSQQVLLVNHQDVAILRLQAAEIERREGAAW